jgi:tetratricopeptide (TPR) repeat protein
VADSLADTNTLVYQGVFRVYRNAVVAFLRRRLQAEYGSKWEAEVQKPFQHEWAKLLLQVEGARKAGVIEGTITDAADYLSVNHFYNLFDSQFAKLWPDLTGDKDAKDALLHWARGIKVTRDFVAHPSDLSLSFGDAFVLLDDARRILLRVDTDAAQRVSELQTVLLQQPEPEGQPIARYLPPRENVVLDFVGRRTILADLHHWFADPLGRRWLLAGLDGGRGKSAIAYEFAEQITHHRPKELALVAWLSAKQRQYQDGQIVALTPDFVDLESAVDKLLFAYGVESGEPLAEKKAALLTLLNELPALVVVDDVDSLTGQGEQAIEFFAIDIAATASKVLFTARRVPLGMGATVTQVEPFPDEEAREFVESRIRLYQIDRTRLSASAIDDILDMTDRSALYIDDLVRFCKNLSPAEAMRSWAKNRGAKVREYALKREVELLTPLARRLLVACALSVGPISIGELEVVANVSRDDAIDALTELGKYYLVPQPRLIEDQPRYALNSNTQRLVQEVYGRSPEGRAIQAAINHLFGAGIVPEAEREAISICRHAVVLMSVGRSDEAAALLTDALEGQFPNHPRVIGQLAWVYKKADPPRSEEARALFDRAYHLNNRLPEMYKHWADMEGRSEDWQAQLVAANKGIERCGEEPQLLVMAGEAVNRLASRLKQLHGSRADEEHERALALFVRALEASKRIRAEPEQISRIYSGLTRVARVLGRRQLREGYLEQWEAAMPGDVWLSREKERN